YPEVTPPPEQESLPINEDEEAPVSTDINEGGIYLYNFSQPNYSFLWEAFTQQLLSIDSISLSPVNSEEISSRLIKRRIPSLELSFTAPFDAELFFPSRESFQELPLIQNIFIFWEEEPKTFFQTFQGSAYEVSWDNGFSSLFSQVKELSSTTEPDHILLSELAETDSFNQMILEEIYVPAQMPLLPDFNLSRESAKEEELARTFFVDLSLVRQIKERDEAIIFTDGQKGLRISSQGMIEFTAPLQKNVGKRLSYREAMEIGTKFIGLYVDLPEDISLRITELKPITLENKEYFQMKLNGYYGGLVLDPESFMVEITYDEQGLVSYNCQSYIIKPNEEEPVEVQVERALFAVQSSLPELFQGEAPRRITAVYLTYMVTEEGLEELLQPFWNIEIDEKYLVMVNARSGEVMKMIDVN
ncbi:MAG: hypothetical protein Q7I94_06755, partial [Candidatus Contubernalis sp.]|nr:hypothetical protein [Candidatus Contubernalis sp.]